MLLENASTVQSLSDTEKHNSGGVGTGLVRSPSSKETGESERLWDALGMMTDICTKTFVRKHYVSGEFKLSSSPWRTSGRNEFTSVC